MCVSYVDLNGDKLFRFDTRFWFMPEHRKLDINTEFPANTETWTGQYYSLSLAGEYLVFYPFIESVA